MTQKKNLKKISRDVTVDGLMTFGKLDNGLNQASFAPCEHVEVTPYIGRFKVQLLNNGYLHLVQLAKRIRNSPLFRLAHSRCITTISISQIVRQNAFRICWNRRPTRLLRE